jgi:hypothetical protein
MKRTGYHRPIPYRHRLHSSSSSGLDLLLKNILSLDLFPVIPEPAHRQRHSEFNPQPLRYSRQRLTPCPSV